MKRQIVAVVAVLVGLATPVYAQAAQAQWVQGPDLATAVGATYTWQVDTGVVTPITAACVAQPAPALPLCTATIPAVTAGAHSYALTASNAFGSATTRTATGQAPSAPGSIKIIVTVQVTTPDEELEE
jgi:hypothetical protein